MDRCNPAQIKAKAIIFGIFTIGEVMLMTFLEISALLMLLLAVADFALKHGKKTLHIFTDVLCTSEG